MNRIITIARNTFTESVRDKVLYVLLFFALATILGSKILGWISIGQSIKIIKDISLAAMSVFGALIAIFVGATLVYKEIDKKTLYTILAQPMKRHEFIIGKYLGLVSLLAVSLFVMAVGSTFYLKIAGATLGIIWIQAIILIYMKLLLITAVAILLSSLVSPILGAIIVFSFYVGGHATDVFRDLPPQFKDTFSKKILEIMYYVVPNLNLFNIQSEAANMVPVTWAYICYTLCYSLSWTVLLLILACLAFERRDV